METPGASDAERRKSAYTHIPTQRSDMGTRNISISDEAYSRLMALKKPGESFTDVVNRLTGRRSVLELAGLLTPREAGEVRLRVRELRVRSSERVASTARRLREP